MFRRVLIDLEPSLNKKPPPAVRDRLEPQRRFSNTRFKNAAPTSREQTTTTAAARPSTSQSNQPRTSHGAAQTTKPGRPSNQAQARPARTYAAELDVLEEDEVPRHITARSGP
ncbi:hypothetical protein AURDEDRAFT_177539 [Auricularia subglabra TFB-10046 SS5]|uniref:Uncharacterized protein n=1 Tax=Auricularia subglabra (strain TFB-10046 / SS5) TaxID=717982 RepID=J0WM16_AURST|nr:hypothetical protein AURDEDRAFT_177539 [Auricularia subglabra TFB-10046 SS5]